MAHTVSTTAPVGAAVGDEWYNPSNNKFYKWFIVGGTSPQWVDQTTLSSGTSGGSGATGATGPTGLSGLTSFTGNTIAIAARFVNVSETVTLNGITLGSVGNTQLDFDFSNAAIVLFTANTAGNWQTNFRLSSVTSLNTALANGESVTATIYATQGQYAYYSTATLIDNAAVTVKWQDGYSPVGGNPYSTDVYTYSIIKTANATYTVLGSQSRFV
jgi:hypothetical protein